MLFPTAPARAGSAPATVTETDNPNGSGIPFYSVLKAGDDDERVWVYSKTKSPFHPRERLCVVHDYDPKVCGRVLEVRGNLTVIRNEFEREKFSPGELVQVLHVTRWPASVQGSSQGIFDDERKAETLFRFYTIAAVQPGSTVGGFLGAAWVPSWPLSNSFSLRGNLALSFLPKASGGYFAAPEYELYLSFWPIRYLALEGGAGAQTWVGFGGTRPLFSFDVVWRFRGGRDSFGELFDIVDRLFVSYGAFLDNQLVSELRLGIGFHF